MTACSEYAPLLCGVSAAEPLVPRRPVSDTAPVVASWYSRRTTVGVQPRPGLTLHPAVVACPSAMDADDTLSDAVDVLAHGLPPGSMGMAPRRRGQRHRGAGRRGADRGHQPARHPDPPMRHHVSCPSQRA